MQAMQCPSFPIQLHINPFMCAKVAQQCVVLLQYKQFVLIISLNAKDYTFAMVVQFRAYPSSKFDTCNQLSSKNENHLLSGVCTEKEFPKELSHPN